MSVVDQAGLTVEIIPLASLRSHPRNYRKHPEDQLLHLEQSLRESGWYRNVVIARDDTILAGHGIVEAARRLGFTDAPCHRLPLDPDDPRAIKVLAGDNELARFAENDDRLLADLLRDVRDQDLTGLLGTGHDGDTLAALLADIAQTDAAAPAPVQPPAEFGKYDEDLPTDYCCPSCGYEWSGKPK